MDHLPPPPPPPPPNRPRPHHPPPNPHSEDDEIGIGSVAVRPLAKILRAALADGNHELPQHHRYANNKKNNQGRIAALLLIVLLLISFWNSIMSVRLSSGSSMQIGSAQNSWRYEDNKDGSYGNGNVVAAAAAAAAATSVANDTTISSSSSLLDNINYSWYGDHWMPPPGVPSYSREDMIQAFSQFDTLWIGDSTTRRAYATTFALLNSTQSQHVPKVSLDHWSVIDINRKKVVEVSCTQQAKATEEHYQSISSSGTDRMMWKGECLCRQVNGRAFHFVRANCWRDLERLAVEEEWDLQHYSLIIIGAGIWDVIRQGVCQPHYKVLDEDNNINGSENTTITASHDMMSSAGENEMKSSYPISTKNDTVANETKDGMDTTTAIVTPRIPPPRPPILYSSVQERLEHYGLSALNRLAGIQQKTFSRDVTSPNDKTSPSAVLYRTTGYQSKSDIAQQAMISDLNHQFLDWIDNYQRQHQQQLDPSQPPNNNYVLPIDWSTVMVPRSLGTERIVGDLAPHFGLEARLLMAQMTTQQVMKVLELSRSTTTT